MNGFRISAQILANMNKKVRNKYGADAGAAAAGGENNPNFTEHGTSNGSY